MRDFFIGLIYENGAPSRTGLIAIIVALVPFLIWEVVTVYLVAAGKTWPHYEAMTAGVFGTSAAGSGVLAYNKYTNSRFNSMEFQPPVKGIPSSIPSEQRNERTV